MQINMPPQSQIRVETLEAYTAYWQAGHNGLEWRCPFTMPPWLAAWWPEFARGHTLKILSIRSGKRLVGLAPLMEKDGRVRLIGDKEVCDHLDVVVDPAGATEFHHQLLDHLCETGVRQLVLDPVREDAVVAAGLIAAAESRGIRVHGQRTAQLFAMPLPDSWEAYLQDLSGKERHEIRRKLRRLDRAGRVEFECIRDPDALPRAMDTFFALFRSNRNDKAAFMTGSMLDYFGRLAAHLAAAGLLKLYILNLDDRPIAAAMCIDDRSTVYLYNNGYDAAFSNLSAGLLSKVLTIQASIADGRRVYDFLKGDEAYKKRLGGHPIGIYRYTLDINPGVR